MQREIVLRNYRLPVYLIQCAVEKWNAMRDDGTLMPSAHEERVRMEDVWFRSMLALIISNTAWSRGEDGNYRTLPLKNVGGHENVFVGAACMFPLECVAADGTVDDGVVRSKPGLHFIWTDRRPRISKHGTVEQQWDAFGKEVVDTYHIYADQAEWDRFIDLKDRTARYQAQAASYDTPQFVSYERIMDEEEHAFASRLMRTPPHSSLVQRYYDEYHRQYTEMTSTYTDPTAVAAFLHNAFVFVRGKWDFNGHTARLLGNLYLLKHMYPPFAPLGTRDERYLSAVNEDMQAMRPTTCEVPKVRYAAVQRYLKQLKQRPPCYRCGKRPADGPSSPPFKRCVQCGLVSYCSRECQREDWRDANGHRLFCLDNKISQ